MVFRRIRILVTSLLSVIMIFGLFPECILRADTDDTVLDINVDMEWAIALENDFSLVNPEDHINISADCRYWGPGAYWQPGKDIRVDMPDYFSFQYYVDDLYELGDSLRIRFNGNEMTPISNSLLPAYFNPWVNDRYYYFNYLSHIVVVFVGHLEATDYREETDQICIQFYTNATAMDRLYNPNSGEHFYTSNPAERNNLISLGWNFEGVGWVAPASSNTPVYRMYNPFGGEHHYTTSLAERDMLIDAGWNYEDIGWYSDDAETQPLYRQYNPNAFANNHNYTTSLEENNSLIALGWRAEGTGWYGRG